MNKNKLVFEMSIEYDMYRNDNRITDYAWTRLSEARNAILGMILLEEKNPNLDTFSLTVTEGNE